MDTLTDRVPGQTPQPGVPTTIPVRFHLYWAGSDKDGTVTGFYWAVTETIATALDFGTIPPLPGPKPQDYHFTTRTDTTFVFNVTENAPDRQHAFFIYAVDNQGKPDPTPARFIFNAIDKFPPRPLIMTALATGEIVNLTADGTPVLAQQSWTIRDTLNPQTQPTDTVAAGSRVDFAWRGLITLAGTYVTNYRYKFDEPQFVTVDSSVHSVTYGAGTPDSPPISPGTKLFTLRALDQAGGAGETTRRFVMNFSPDTWWAGPDLTAWPTASNGDGKGVDVTGYNPLTTNPPLPSGTFINNDSLQYLPSKRFPPGRDFSRPGTFYEIYGDQSANPARKTRIYARQEGDIVHMNSIIVLVNGGYDKDSPYIPRVDTTDVVLTGVDPASPVLTAQGKVGSPIGFRSIVVGRLTPDGAQSIPAQTTIYPLWQPASVFRRAAIGGYWRMFKAGKYFALARAEDSDGGLDNAIIDPVTLVNDVDGPNNEHPGTGGTPDERVLRRKVIVFYVDKPPRLVRNNTFLPREGQTINTALWSFNLIAADDDPYDIVNDPNPTPGGPTNSTVIRFKITLTGLNLAGRDTSWIVPPAIGGVYFETAGTAQPQFIPGGSMTANPFASGPIQVHIETCDCVDCENSPGAGRCVEDVINVNYVRPAGEPGLQPTQAGRPGPDASGRRD